MKYAILKTKHGWVGIGIDRGAVCAATVSPSRSEALAELAERFGASEPAIDVEAAPLVDLVRRAADGERVKLNGQLRIVAGTPFQRSVWQAMRSIPHGATVSYGELARRVGRPGSARAVGQAVGNNPIPILIPCHRVIGSDGSLTGFGGGLPMKRALLRQEGVKV